jgi:prevent-host-death family protein
VETVETMQRTISITELQRGFRSVLDEVAKKHVPYVLTRGSRPEAALIPYERSFCASRN